MSNAHDTWRRVSRAHPCPVCGKPDWCAVSVDGGAVLCQRVESAQRVGEGGWLHRLKGRPRQERRRVRSIRLSSGGAVREDLARLAEEYRRAADPGRLYQFACSLGLSVTSLCQLGVGWSADHRAWSFPMCDAGCVVLGIRLRRPNGFKFAVKGGSEGLFLPAAAGDEFSPLYVCEGPTDVAAVLDMGFPNVVGRPSCTGGVKLLVELVRRRRPSEVVIVGDGDEPGRRGAGNLASVLAAYAPAVRLVAPPAGVKDARDWLRAGGGRKDVELAIQAAPVRALQVWARRVSHRG